MIVRRPGIGVDVLDVIEEHDRPQGEERGQPKGEDPRHDALVQAEKSDAERHERDVRPGPHDVLHHDLAKERTVVAPCLTDVRLDGLTLEIRRDEEVRRGDERVVAVRVAPGDRRVARLVDELMVIEVVRRNPRERGVAVEHRQPIAEDAVHAPALERRAMIVVMRDDAG